MCRILVDAARSRAAEPIALDDTLSPLADFDPRKFRVVETRFCGGLTADRTAAVLKVSEPSRAARLEARPRLAEAPDRRRRLKRSSPM